MIGVVNAEEKGEGEKIESWGEVRRSVFCGDVGNFFWNKNQKIRHLRSHVIK